MHFLNIQIGLICQKWDLTHNESEFFKCMGIMLANLCHPYILSTTVLSDISGAGRHHTEYTRLSRATADNAWLSKQLENESSRPRAFETDDRGKHAYPDSGLQTYPRQ